MNLDFLNNNQSKDMYVVYQHTNIINGKVYIGITCQDPKVRWSNGYGYRNNEYFWRSIQKYGWPQGFTHEILYEDLTYEEACQIEIDLIAKYNSTNRDFGYNHHKGGRYQDHETRQKISEHTTTKKVVLQYSKDGDFISEYESIMAASKATCVSYQGIWSACNGNIFSSGGYFWCYKDNVEKIKSDLEKYRSDMERVLQFDLNGNLLNDYQHVYEASERTGIDRYKIWKVCFEKLEPLDGFLFCYENKRKRVQKWIKQYRMLNEQNMKNNFQNKRSAGPVKRKNIKN